MGVEDWDKENELGDIWYHAGQPFRQYKWYFSPY